MMAKRIEVIQSEPLRQSDIQDIPGKTSGRTRMVHSRDISSVEGQRFESGRRSQHVPGSALSPGRLIY